MLFAIYLVIAFALVAAAGATDLELEEAVLLAILWPFALVLAAIYLPFIAAHKLGLYINQRLRKEQN